MTRPASPKAALECPVCGAPNDCAPARTGTFDTPCWCTSVTVDPASLAALPERLRGEACLCPRCAAVAAEHMQTSGGVRFAARSDIPSMHRIRLAVREDRLTSTVITEDDYVPSIESTGRGWVAEDDGVVVGFAVGNRVTGNIWALFVDPEHEGRGHGRRLHDAMVDWLFLQGVPRLWLTTAPQTRAQKFYAAAGWTFTGMQASGEAHYELRRASAS